MPRWLQWVFGASITLLVVVAPVAYAIRLQSNIRRFHVVEEGVLYRSGQLSPSHLQRVVKEYRLKTIVSLRAAQPESETQPDDFEEDFCQSEGIRFFRIPQKAWDAERGAVPDAKNVAKFLDIVKNPANHPVLVHCLAGRHRTGSSCAIFRMECNHWPAEFAVKEMKLYGHDLLDEHLDLLGYLMRYQPTWLTNGNDARQSLAFPIIFSPQSPVPSTIR